VRRFLTGGGDSNGTWIGFDPWVVWV